MVKNSSVSVSDEEDELFEMCSSFDKLLTDVLLSETYSELSLSSVQSEDSLGYINLTSCFSCVQTLEGLAPF